jgi:phytoene/squalene synthetase/2-polyprenyl-6-methoxyphenol hydroxylase-like FAD-dependent oxidoreductase
MVRSNYDVVVVGGGPVGAVAAISAARTGASVLVLEANPDAAKRFAGEWLHPAGVAVLDRLRIGRLEGASPRTGYGFVVFPDDGSSSIELAYPQGQIALCTEHAKLVEALRARATQHEGVTFLSHARVVDLDGHLVTFRYQGADQSVHAGRIIACDGRSSFSRKHLSEKGHGEALSYMASVELSDVELPVEGYGHVVLGGPGPVLLYRIGPNEVRGCFDVPLRFDENRRQPAFLWDAFGAVLPARLRESFRAALADKPVTWAVNRFAPRVLYGRDSLWLAGDAVGHFHPLTAAGLTLGFLDAERAGTLSSLSEYQRERERRSYVPELLSNALYQVFSRDDANATQIRSAIHHVWRKSASERERTMRILMGEESRRSVFGAAFVRMATAALSEQTRALFRRERVTQLPSTLLSYGEWARWPAASLATSRARREQRPKSSSEQPPQPLRLLSLLPRPKKANDAIEIATEVALPVSVNGAIARACDGLLAELKRLHERIGSDPDWTLALRAVELVAAIDEARLGPAMAARMQLARRPMARVGMERLLTAHAAIPDAVRATDVASFISGVLPGSEQWRVERLEEGLRFLLQCQHESGGFGELQSRASAANLRSTEKCCRALASCRQRDGTAFPPRFAQALQAAQHFILTSQKEDGSWPQDEGADALVNTACAIDALVACGEPVTSAALRRATRFLAQLQHADGCFDTGDDRLPNLLVTARVVRALLSAPGPHWSVVERAVLPLSLHLKSDLVEAVAADRDGAARACAEVVSVLVSYERARRARPRADGQERGLGDDWEFCRNSLVAVSRTFSKPIQMLPGELEVAVTCGYLLCRIADTIEDHTSVPGARREALFGSFLDVIERGAPPRGLSLAFDEIEGADAELALARNLPRVMRVFWSLSAPVQTILTRWVGEMARGMNLYIHREPGADGFTALYTVEDLERYCYYVAGTVGHMLTELFAHALGSELGASELAELRHHAESFGAGLQLVNILKDVTDDRERRWSFIPRAACERAGIDIESLTKPALRARAHEAVAPIFDVAEQRLERALTYALLIPKEQRGIRLFCLLPLWMAALTLVHGRGNDAMFNSGEEVKISREEVERVIAECAQHVSDNAALRKRYRALWQRAAQEELRA